MEFPWAALQRRWRLEHPSLRKHMDEERKHLWVQESKKITKCNADKKQILPFFHGNTRDKYHMTAHAMKWKSNGREDQSKCRENKRHQLVIGFQCGTLPTDCVFIPTSQLLVLLVDFVDTLGGETWWEADHWSRLLGTCYSWQLPVSVLPDRAWNAKMSFATCCHHDVLPNCMPKGLQPESMSQDKSFYLEAACRVCSTATGRVTTEKASFPPLVITVFLTLRQNGLFHIANAEVQGGTERNPKSHSWGKLDPKLGGCLPHKLWCRVTTELSPGMRYGGNPEIPTPDLSITVCPQYIPWPAKAKAYSKGFQEH